MKIGIDYGSKLAGTTVIAYAHQGLIHLEKSTKNQDADQMILNFVEMHKSVLIGLDAPLSLPGVYTGLVGFEDYHYRRCDKALKAMSPMFLGGLSARAMKLKSALEKRGAKVLEVYPVMTGKELGLVGFGYRKKEANYGAILEQLKKDGIQLASDTYIDTSHDLDAILALHAIRRAGLNNENKAGDLEEAVIYF